MCLVHINKNQPYEGVNEFLKLEKLENILKKIKINYKQ